MAARQNQLFTKERFEAFMDDHDDDEYSIGSARGSIGGHARLGGLGGMRPVSKDPGGLGGLGGSRGGSVTNSPNKGMPARGGLGGLSGLGGLGGLGGLSRSGAKTLGGLKGTAGQIGGLRGRSTGEVNTTAINSGLKEHAGPVGEGEKVASDTTHATVEALKNITSLVQNLSEKTLHGFKEVSNRLNQETV
jgi:hypothetical protein